MSQSTCMQPSRIYVLGLMLAVTLVPAYSAVAASSPTPVDNTDEQTLMTSAIEAFHIYLKAVDEPDLIEARSYVLDPGDAQGQATVMQQLLAFVRARSTSDINNEGVVVKTQGDWALAVYQYDAKLGGQRTRVITTAWMIQWQGVWKQFIIAPTPAEEFWETRESDYRELQHWFDTHAAEISS